MLKEKAEQICSAFSFVCVYAGSRLISGSGLRILPFRYEAVRGVSALSGAALAVCLVSGGMSDRGRCAPERRIGEVSVSAAFSRRIGAVLGFRRAFRLYGGTVSAQGISRSAQRLGSGVCPAGSAFENRAVRDNGDCFFLKHRLHEERHSVISNIGIVHCLAV